MRAAGLLATLNTDDPAMIGLDLATEYASVQAAYHYSWDDMIAIALDGVEAAWLDDNDRTQLTGRVHTAATQLRPRTEPGQRDARPTDQDL